MSVTTIKRDVPADVQAVTRCDCLYCTASREQQPHLVAGWDVLVNGRIRCPECGAQIHPHFSGKHKAWHLDEGTVTQAVYDEWSASGDVRVYRASAQSDAYRA